MRIAIVAHLKYPIGQPFAGGLELHTHLTATRLRQRGHDVVLFAAKGSDPSVGTVEVCDPTGEADAEGLEGPAYRAIMARIAQGGFDLVHNNALHDVPLRASRDLVTPMLSVLHTPPFLPYTDGIRVRDPRMPILAVSASLAEAWRDIVPDAEVVDNGIDLDAFPFSARLAEEGYAFWSGRIVPEKGLHLAIDAARAAELPLVFAGPRHPGAYWNEEIAPRLGAGVSDAGHLTQGDLAAWLGRARVALVSPRWEEPFGLVVVEALACGTPVAGFRRGALPDILSPATGRLATPDDPRDLARAAREAMSLDRAACRRRAEQRYDADGMIDAYERIYRGMLGHEGASSLALPGRPSERRVSA